MLFSYLNRRGDYPETHKRCGELVTEYQIPKCVHCPLSKDPLHILCSHYVHEMLIAPVEVEDRLSKLHALKLFPSFGSIALFGATPCPMPSYPSSGAYVWLHVLKLFPSLESIALCGATSCPTPSNPRVRMSSHML